MHNDNSLICGPLLLFPLTKVEMKLLKILAMRFVFFLCYSESNAHNWYNYILYLNPKAPVWTGQAARRNSGVFILSPLRLAFLLPSLDSLTCFGKTHIISWPYMSMMYCHSPKIPEKASFKFEKSANPQREFKENVRHLPAKTWSLNVVDCSHPATLYTSYNVQYSTKY